MCTPENSFAPFVFFCPDGKPAGFRLNNAVITTIITPASKTAACISSTCTHKKQENTQRKTERKAERKLYRLHKRSIKNKKKDILKN